jgi:hypothetical protein
MPSFLTHALIGYLFFDYKGMIIALIPDFISYVHYFHKLSQKYDTYNFLTLASNATPNDLEKIDYQLYDTGHSLVFWLIALFIFKDKAIYAGIFAIIMDIFLHSNEKWVGPAFMYPLSDYRFNGISWSSPKGRIIVFTIIVGILIMSKNTKQKIIDKLYI